ncbi:ATP-binding protein [Vannielia sp.]|uniref:hybrid sensor histidine kinase/response regulator n=1 Tax=Vannielia sp. TaxID=2813045 RepID=UPI00262C5596|nr:ATP-binding protein [Vannielia sp.]MDF1873133.1 response regulator [Vannielia sp.]
MAEDWLPPGDHRSGGASREAALELFSHDIRSAVSDVVSGLRLVDMSTLDPATAAQLQRVSTAGEALAGLLDSALSQLEGRGTLPVAPDPATEPVPLLAILRNLERRWAGHARERGMQLRLKIAADLPTVIHLDAVAVDRVLANLLSNAFKYADWGAVTLAVSTHTGGELRFTVRDRGPGFSDAALARLFERGGRPQGQTRPGSGLGLHIAKELATRLGGQLQASNTSATGGAEVSLSLPRVAWAWQRDRAGDSAAASGPPSLPDLSGLTVLVAEDNATNQLLFTQMLDHLGATWKIAPDGAEALSAIKAGSYDFALVDIDMPRLSGTEVIAATRALPSDTRLMPMIAVTAYVLQEHRERIYAAGADGILAKPVHSLAAFGQAIATLMLRTRGAAPALLPDDPTSTADDTGPQAAPAPPSTDDEPTEFSVERLERLLAISGSDKGQEFLTRLLTDLRRTRTGLATAIETDDAAAIRGHTHVLISLSGAIGAEMLQTLACRANAAAHRADAAACLTESAAEIDSRLESLITLVAEEFSTRFPAVEVGP